MDPDSNNSRQNTVDYLIKAASLLPAESYHQKLLKAFYLTKCKQLAQSDQQTIFSDEEMCRKCSTPWMDLNYSLSIAPIKTTKRKAHKIQKQIEEKSNRKKHVAKKLSKRVNNTVTIKCKLCSNKNKVPLWKKPADAKKPKQEEMPANCNQNKSTNETMNALQLAPSKKKRKKDKNAGLFYSLTKDTNAVNKIVKVQPKPHPQAPKIQMNVNLSKQLDKKLNLNANKKKTKTASGAKVKLKNILQPATKRSSLLQLANALKAKTNPSSSSQGDKLKHLLR